MEALGPKSLLIPLIQGLGFRVWGLGFRAQKLGNAPALIPVDVVDLRTHVERSYMRVYTGIHYNNREGTASPVRMRPFSGFPNITGTYLGVCNKDYYIRIYVYIGPHVTEPIWCRSKIGNPQGTPGKTWKFWRDRGGSS